MGRFITYVIVIVILVLGGAQCGNMVHEREAIRAAETMGFSDIHIVKRDIWFVWLRGGSNTDNVRFTIKAANAAGKNVEFYVFAGWPFKAATIRTK